LTGTAATTPGFLVSGAEALVRVRPVGLSAERARLTVESGPWLRDPAAGIARGILAVPLDDVTGYIVAAGSPRHTWPVSLGIRLDLIADPPVDGSELVVTGELVARDERAGTTRGTVSARDGAVLALITQRSHLIPVDGPPTVPAMPFEAPPAGVGIRDALGVREIGRGILELPGTPLAANGSGNVHGGILIATAEFAAMSALGADGALRGTSIDTVFVRPASAGETTTFRAEVLHTGRSLAVVRVIATGATGKTCAIATVTVQRVTS
jgi:uncharacterized protein (TIGR00369 family)